MRKITREHYSSVVKTLRVEVGGRWNSCNTACVCCHFAQFLYSKAYYRVYHLASSLFLIYYILILSKVLNHLSFHMYIFSASSNLAFVYLLPKAFYINLSQAS